jgi:hypothetical protein
VVVVVAFGIVVVTDFLGIVVVASESSGKRVGVV